MRPARIAHVLNTIGLGGVPEACFHLLENLSRERYDARVYVLRRADDDADARDERLRRFAAIGVPVSFPTSGKDKLAVVGDLSTWLIDNAIDLLHTHSYKPNLYGRLAGALCHPQALKMVAHYHNQYHNKWDTDGLLPLERRLSECSAGLVACSHSVADHIAERVGVARDRVTTVLNGVDADLFASGNRQASRLRLAIPQNRVAIGLVGRISEQKGQEEFLRAAAIVRGQFPAALFLVIGSADDPALLTQAKDLVAVLGLDDCVRFTGHVTDMPDVYAALDIVAAPSRWEGFGLMLVEAMAAGKPIVATRVGAIPEVCVDRETALLVPPRDPAALAAALLDVLQDPDMGRALGEAGIRRAAAFSWQRSAETLDALYQRLLAPEGV